MSLVLSLQGCCCTRLTVYINRFRIIIACQRGIVCVRARVLACVCAWLNYIFHLVSVQLLRTVHAFRVRLAVPKKMSPAKPNACHLQKLFRSAPSVQPAQSPLALAGDAQQSMAVSAVTCSAGSSGRIKRLVLAPLLCTAVVCSMLLTGSVCQSKPTIMFPFPASLTASLPSLSAYTRQFMDGTRGRSGGSPMKTYRLVWVFFLFVSEDVGSLF